MENDTSNKKININKYNPDIFIIKTNIGGRIMEKKTTMGERK